MRVHVSEFTITPDLCLARNRYLMYFAHDCSVHVSFFSSSVFSKLTQKDSLNHLVQMAQDCISFAYAVLLGSIVFL